MRRLSVAGQQRCRLHPARFGLRVHRRGELIVDHARRRHGVGRHVEHEVRLAQRPVRRRMRLLRQRIIALATRRARLDPVDHRADLVGRKPAIVLELADRRIRMPGRHRLGADRLADHRREHLHLIVVRHRKRRDAAGLVTDNALLLEDRRHVLRVGNLRMLRAPAAVDEVDRRTLAHNVRGRDGAPGQHVAQRFLQIALGARCRRAAIHRTMIQDAQRLRLDQEGLARIGDAQLLASQLQLVMQHRHRHTQTRCFRRHLAARIRA